MATLKLRYNPLAQTPVIVAKATAAVDNIYTLFNSPMQTILTEFKLRLPSSPCLRNPTRLRPPAVPLLFNARSVAVRWVAIHDLRGERLRALIASSHS